jgi:hypothetical protein
MKIAWYSYGSYFDFNRFEWFLGDSLMALGHEVLVDFPGLPQDFDLALSLKFTGIAEKRSKLLFYWSEDDPRDATDGMSREALNPIYDCVLTPSRTSLEKYLAKHVRAFPFVFCAPRSELLSKIPPHRRSLDVTFIGREEGREETLQKLGSRVNKPHPILLYPDVLSVYARSKICLDIKHRTTMNGQPLEVDCDLVYDRCFEITAMGALLLAEDHEGLHECWEVGREIQTWKTLDECNEKIDYYLTHEEERESMARSGRDRTLRDHVGERRAEELLKIANKI